MPQYNEISIEDAIKIHTSLGSVGIAGNQTGIYPIESPGGWQLIGRTPVNLYDPYRKEPVLLNVGDYIKFVQIDEIEFKILRLWREKENIK